MKIIKTLVLFLMTLTLFSCSHFKDGTSVWAGSLWLIFWLPFLGSLPFFYYAYKAKKSGYKKRANEFEPWQDAQGELAITQIPQFWFGVALQVIAWGICIGVNFSV